MRRTANPKHGRAVAVDPRHVVDQHQQRTLGGDLAQQGQHHRRDDQRIQRRSRRQTEDLAEDVAMMGSEPVSTVAQWVEQLVQRGEADLGLELHPRGPQHPPTGRLGPHRRRVQQRGLSHPRVAAQQLPRAGRAAPGKQRLDQLQLVCAPQQIYYRS
jgi:hypothetical protein